MPPTKTTSTEKRMSQRETNASFNSLDLLDHPPHRFKLPVDSAPLAVVWANRFWGSTYLPVWATVAAGQSYCDKNVQQPNRLWFDHVIQASCCLLFLYSTDMKVNSTTSRQQVVRCKLSSQRIGVAPSPPTSAEQSPKYSQSTRILPELVAISWFLYTHPITWVKPYQKNHHLDAL